MKGVNKGQQGLEQDVNKVQKNLAMLSKDCNCHQLGVSKSQQDSVLIESRVQQDLVLDVNKGQQGLMVGTSPRNVDLC